MRCLGQDFDIMDAIGLQKAREGIISHINSNGPSLPATISSSLRVPLLFISAFLSELYREQKLRMSHMKVGTSSLYLLPGQDKQLENFIQHLNQREREALSILRQKNIIKDSELEPVHRVAIREIKDFALPVQKNGELFWEYAFAEKIDTPEVKEIKVEEKKTEQSNNDEIETKPKKVRVKKQSIQSQTQEFSLSLANVEQTTPFSEEVRSFLERNNYTINNLVKADKKECAFKATIPGPHGHQSYLVIAKDKKKLKEEEISSALQEAHNQRLLCLLLGRGEADKKTSAFISSWNNFVSYRMF